MCANLNVSLPLCPRSVEADQETPTSAAQGTGPNGEGCEGPTGCVGKDSWEEAGRGPMDRQGTLISGRAVASSAPSP